MGFEVSPSRVIRRRSLAPVVAVIVLAVATVAIALVTSRSPAVGPSVVCHELDPPTCQQVAQAALDVVRVEGREPVDVAVWPSLICGSDADCPLARLARRQALGSAVVSFGPGRPEAWTNVLGPARSGVNASPGVDAWVIRWVG
ncbi:MAG: hypothetical protein ACJ761_05010 [Chloroflexota bacterium]